MEIIAAKKILKLSLFLVIEINYTSSKIFKEST